MDARPPRTLRPRRLLLAAGVVALLGIAAVAAAVPLTDQPSFCATCHEMTPYVNAWEGGPHAAVPCVDCHVGDGLIERAAHKLEALDEVRVHITGNPSFPLAVPPEVPDERCVGCHADIGEGSSLAGAAGGDPAVDADGDSSSGADAADFSHAEHASEGSCVSCHPDAGHVVTDAALLAAGVFDSAAAAGRRIQRVAATGVGAANVANHLPTSCDSCHDMRETGCASCHEPEHGERTADSGSTGTEAGRGASTADDPLARATAGVPPRELDCTACHAPGPSWQFRHPDETACDDCHTIAETHREVAQECVTCHEVPGATWAFAHPDAEADCATCHARPEPHDAGSCTSCHDVAGDWAFRHPASTSCDSCHARPAGHRSGTCSACHSSTASWAFRHPGTSSSCESCHTRPSGHARGSCTSCHSTASWAFRHTSSTACASCHSAPARHYGSSCASCHSPSRAWSSATFTHPGIPGGEHTSRSFSCSSCHPSSYSTYTCTGCHDSNDPDDEPEEEDDD